MILSFENFVNERYQQRDVQALNAYMNDRKVKHSCKVAEIVKLFTDSEDLYQAALYHDYIERGGKKEELLHLISPYATELVMHLTKTEDLAAQVEDDNETLAILRLAIENLPESVRNDIVVIKVADRADNLRKREKKGELSKGYIKKSAELVEYLFNSYTGANKKAFKKFIKKNFLSVHPKVEKMTKLPKIKLLALAAQAAVLDDAAINQVAG